MRLSVLQGLPGIPTPLPDPRSGPKAIRDPNPRPGPCLLVPQAPVRTLLVLQLFLGMVSEGGKGGGGAECQTAGNRRRGQSRG